MAEFISGQIIPPPSVNIYTGETCYQFNAVLQTVVRKYDCVLIGMRRINNFAGLGVGGQNNTFDHRLDPFAGQNHPMGQYATAGQTDNQFSLSDPVVFSGPTGSVQNPYFVTHSIPPSCFFGYVCNIRMYDTIFIFD